VTEAAHLSHVHEASLETSLDFINTLEFSRVASTEHLPGAEDAARWLGERGVAHADDVLISLRARGGLERFRGVRSALREVSEATAVRRPADRTALDRINAALAARSRLELVPAADGVALGHRHVGDALDDALATLVEPVVREIAAGHRERLRICANDTCRWVFFDGSRTGRRRWCDMSTCGNRAKAARHRARTRGAVDPPA
jgi:predicted RNA-binding Zn ribbon-like protein